MSFGSGVGTAKRDLFPLATPPKIFGFQSCTPCWRTRERLPQVDRRLGITVAHPVAAISRVGLTQGTKPRSGDTDQ